ncbi:hypothetical protein K461DRAFT_138144 [Myriangium duriaei CBS 260.36]|uniref:Uncharacterized protein n=1 Tax=Myriangium duriaei CBS 260.36 TaxID=1168546 RepID=A0A9P4J6I7_9PEZI|nr:hypothetical protein K461DRAFT_138144 [Myriangium duriaei CBS 260.36]
MSGGTKRGQRVSATPGSPADLSKEGLRIPQRWVCGCQAYSILCLPARGMRKPHLGPRRLFVELYRPCQREQTHTSSNENQAPGSCQTCLHVQLQRLTSVSGSWTELMRQVQTCSQHESVLLRYLVQWATGGCSAEIWRRQGAVVPSQSQRQPSV